ncbi:MAG: hypothetical protein JW829_11690 [Pirellulales bacterium]|nr:hypothetical protein [Pirellulales bacterium]
MSRGKDCAHALTAWCLGMVGILYCCQAFAQLSHETEHHEELSFRYILIDAEHIATWDMPGQRFLPIKREEFSRLLEMARPVHRDTPIPIQSIRFELQLTEGGILNGTADLLLDHRLGMAPGSPDPAIDGRMNEQQTPDGQSSSSGALGQMSLLSRFLLLDPVGLALTDVVWISENGERSTAQWGTSGWNAQDESVRQGVLIDRSGTLRLEFLVLGYRDNQGAFQYEIHLPTAALRQVVLDYPQELAPEVTGAHLLSTGRANTGRRRVEYQLAPQQPFTITVQNPAVRRNQCRQASYRQKTQYVVSERGLDISADFWITSPDDLPTPFWFKVEEGLAIKEVEVDGKPAQWSYEEPTIGDQTRIYFRPVDHGSRHTAHVVIHGLATTCLNATWRLPRIQLEDLFWSQGSVTLSVSEPILVESLEMVESTQVLGTENSEISMCPGAENTYAFEEFSSDAAIDVRLMRRSEKPVSCPLMVAVVGAQGISAKAVIDLPLGSDASRQSGRNEDEIPTKQENEPPAEPTSPRSASQPEHQPLKAPRFAVVHTFQVPIADEWAIESVEGLSGVVVRDWFVQNMDRAKHLRVSISASTPLEQSQPRAQLILNGQRYTPLEQTDWHTNDFHMLQLEPNPDTSTHLYIQPAPKYGLIRSDPMALETTTFHDMDPELLAGLGLTADKILYSIPDTDQNIALRLERRGPEFEALLENLVEIRDGIIHQVLQVHVTPREGLIEEMEVDVTGGMARQLNWQFTGDQRPISAQCILDHIDKPTGQVLARWRLSLGGHREGPVQMEAVVDSPLDESGSLLMPAVRRATHQEGRINIRCTPTNAVSIDSIGLVREPIPSETADKVPDICGVYRYDPSHDVSSYAGASVLIRPHDGTTSEPWAWVWSAELQSIVPLDGNMQHTAILNVETTGLDRFTCRLPPDAQLIDLAINNRPVPLSASDGKNTSQAQVASTVHIELPPQERYPIVRIRYAVPSKAYWMMHRVQPAMVEPSISVAAWHWSVLVPTGYEMVDLAEVGQTLGQSIARRFLKPLTMMASDIPGTSHFPNPLGWREHPIDLDLPVYLVHIQTTCILSFLSFCVAMVFMVGPFANFQWCRLGALLLTCVAVLILPVTVAPIASGAFLGVMAAMAGRRIRLAWKERTCRREKVSEQPLAPAISQAGSLVVVFAVLVTAGAVSAGVGQLGQPAFGDRLYVQGMPSGPHQVLVPIGKDMQPIGESVFLSDQFYRLLLLRNHQRQQPAGDWMLIHAQYTGRIADGNSSGSNSPWSALYEIRSYVKDSVAYLPLIANEAEWDEHATVDGVEVPIVWTTDTSSGGYPEKELSGSEPILKSQDSQWSRATDGVEGLEGCAIPLPEPGLHQIRLRFIPKTQVDGSNRTWSIHIPKIADTALVLSFLGMEAAAESLVVDGAVQHVIQDGKIYYQLENIDHLTVRHRASAPSFEMDHRVLRPLFWLHIAKDHVFMDLRLRIPWQSKGTNSIMLRLDPRLQFLGLVDTVHESSDPDKEVAVDRMDHAADESAANNGPIVDSESVAKESNNMDVWENITLDELLLNNTKALRLQWDQQEGEPIDIELKFELLGDSGLGRFQLPRIDILGMKAPKAELGVSLAEPLELEMDPSPAALELDPKKFSAAWGEEIPPPKRAFELTCVSNGSSYGMESSKVPEFLWSVRQRKPVSHVDGEPDRKPRNEQHETDVKHEGMTSAREPAGTPRVQEKREDVSDSSTMSGMDSRAPDSRQSGRPQITSAEIRLLRAHNENKEMTAWFSVRSEGASTCELVLPESCQLFHVTLSDIPIAALHREMEAAGGHWSLELDSSPKPQRIRIHYGIKPFSPAIQRRVILPAPQLKIHGQEVPADQVLWHVPLYGTWIPRLSHHPTLVDGRLLDRGTLLAHDLAPLTVEWIPMAGATAVRRTAIAAMILMAVCGGILLLRNWH